MNALACTASDKRVILWRRQLITVCPTSLSQEVGLFFRPIRLFYYHKFISHISPLVLQNVQ